MDYLKNIDLDAHKSDDVKRQVDRLLDAGESAAGYEIAFIVTPVGDGSPAGLHTHTYDQHFLVLDGEMNIEIEGKEFKAGRGSFLIFPAGVPHRNWNASGAATAHLAIFRRPPGDALTTPVKL